MTLVSQWSDRWIFLTRRRGARLSRRVFGTDFACSAEIRKCQRPLGGRSCALSCAKSGGRIPCRGARRRSNRAGRRRRFCARRYTRQSLSGLEIFCSHNQNTDASITLHILVNWFKLCESYIEPWSYVWPNGSEGLSRNLRHGVGNGA